MKLTSILFVATMAIAQAAAIESTDEQNLSHDACYQPNGPCAKLDHAIASAKGILNNPYGPKPDVNSKRAFDYLSTALDQASARDFQAMQKRDTNLERRWRWTNWCGWAGEGCGKARRSATAIQEILGDDKLQKRWSWTNWCGWAGEGCGKARRSIDELLKVSDEVLKSIPQEE
ncbi:hypothetical protein BT63DRAFT_44501 [Microthyrium microscopicum]|uniref:Clock-controlled pheromone ccg-4 n=1 Tax=Microthyrium microscopicum TaxID=703497 RepID=A0A6A6U1E5_9PEZI|nr:hypothetical protein BT63DRAFT_44501 [Microthyrium microscopicum]